MSLATYHKKRKFQKTPEPRGISQKRSGPLMFVVQRHQASRLHYDFRLELDGVLKSWAVPRGPSLDPEERRLAVEVEDHPLDYADFEGIIPKGNYGAGTVMVWDTGVYTPLETVDRDKAEKILSEQLKKGHLTFVMLGKKLKGEFALIKTHNAEENAWLLIKKGDVYASKKDILEKDKSVLTDRTMDQIKTQAPQKKEVWIGKPKDLSLDEAPTDEMPHMIKPMLAETVDEPFDDDEWVFELKLDGYRAIAEIEAGKVHFYSRNQQNYSERFEPIAKGLSKFPGTAVLDGEVVVVDKNGRPNFGWLQSYPKEKHGELRYYVFDILYFDGHNLEKLPLIKRKEILKKLLPNSPHIFFSDHIENNGVEFFKQAVKHNLEGIMAKKADSTYQPGIRTRNWLKIKTQQTQTAVIAGFTEPGGSRKHFGALVLGIYKRGKLEYIGHTGGGFDDKGLESIYDKLKPLEQKESPFDEVPKTNAPVTWVKPVLFCEVSYSEWTKDNIMRHPIFIRLVDEPKGITKPSKLTKETKQTETEITIGTQKLTISNPAKIFWPKEGYTKGDLVEYYKKIAPVILPHLIDRPESLLRFPDGITGESFFQKNASNLTATWVKKTLITKDDKKIKYILCQDEATLLYLINLGCIDLNPWNSIVRHLGNPDYLIIDLDPEAVSYEKVVKVALEFRKLFEKLEIESFPKTSGARGMHIYIPMGALYTYEQTRQFAELLCYHVLGEVPELTSMRRSPKERQGKVYLDYLQNARGQTLASVYSVRPQPEATVSTPLKWSEVTPSLHPSQFTMKNIFKRIDKHGDLFKGVLGKGINIKKVLEKFDLNS